MRPVQICKFAKCRPCLTLFCDDVSSCTAWYRDYTKILSLHVSPFCLDRDWTSFISCYFVSYYVILCHIMSYYVISCVMGLFWPAFVKVGRGRGGWEDGVKYVFSIRSGSQQLTSCFRGANIGMASAQLGGKWQKSWDKAYLNIIDPLHYM
jgi:hypothetical protein